MSAPIDVVVIGAGPYGLSLAAHLRGKGISHRIFGKPMETWRERMPHGMLLKSDGFASNLSAPAAGYTLRDYCEVKGIAYDDTKIPVQLETFIDYGMWFQRQLVPELDTRNVTEIHRLDGEFLIRTDDGEELAARRVVLAVGIREFAWIPPELGDLPPELLTHSSQHPDPAAMAGRDVTVIGGGASAIDLAVLMHEQGAKVCILAHQENIRFHLPPPAGKRSLWAQLRHPSSGLGPGWRSRIYTQVPRLFRQLPAAVRLHIVRTHLGPAPGWPMRERARGVAMILGANGVRAEAYGDGVLLRYVDRAGREAEHQTGHVIAATGYRADVRRLRYLSPAIRQHLRTQGDAPMLSGEFESSVPGLYFVGLASANSFGPMMRFAFGANYTAPRLAGHLERQVKARLPKLAVSPSHALN
jgi:hypothetical protein